MSAVTTIVISSESEEETETCEIIDLLHEDDSDVITINDEKINDTRGNFDVEQFDEEISYFENNESILLYSSDAPNYLVESVAEIIFNALKNKICSKQPIGVTDSCTFVVNLAKLKHRDDIRSDDLGVCTSDGVKSQYCSIGFDQNGIVNRVVKLNSRPSVTRNSI